MVILCNQTLDTPDESTSKPEFELYIVQARRSTVRNCKINTNAAAKRLLFHVFLISQYTSKELLAFSRSMI